MFWRNYSLLFDDTGNFNVSCLDVFTPGVLSNIWNVRKENFYLSAVNFSHSISLKKNYFFFVVRYLFRKFFFFLSMWSNIYKIFERDRMFKHNLFTSIRDLSLMKFKKEKWTFFQSKILGKYRVIFIQRIVNIIYLFHLRNNNLEKKKKRKKFQDNEIAKRAREWMQPQIALTISYASAIKSAWSDPLSSLFTYYWISFNFSNSSTKIIHRHYGNVYYKTVDLL